MKGSHYGPSEINRYARSAAEMVRPYINGFKPSSMIILGSGCGDVANSISIHKEIAYEDITYLPKSSVEGHDGKLILGEYHGKNVLAFKGRHHTYEGYSAGDASFMVYMAKHLGAQTAVVTAASGIVPLTPGQREGVQRGDVPEAPTYAGDVGDLFLIDQIYTNLMPSSLRGPISEDIGPRFNAMMDAPTLSLRLLAHELAQDLDISLTDCVYVPQPGPNFETPTEIEILSQWSRLWNMPVNAGMSTVPELEALNMLGIPSLAITVGTNQTYNLWHVDQAKQRIAEEFGSMTEAYSKYSHAEIQERIGPIIGALQPTHEEVTEVAQNTTSTQNLEKLIGRFIEVVG